MLRARNKICSLASSFNVQTGGNTVFFAPLFAQVQYTSIETNTIRPSLKINDYFYFPLLHLIVLTLNYILETNACFIIKIKISSSLVTLTV